MSGNYIGNNPNGTDYILSDDYRTNNTKLFASTACVNNAVNEIKGTAFLPLGHFFLHPFPTPPDGCLVVNGSEYNRELYKDLFADAVRKKYVKPESEWQQIASENGGYCPWYSSGDGSTTFRTPKFAPYQKLALASGDAGKYYEAGLPNIEGSVGDIVTVSQVITDKAFTTTDNGLHDLNSSGTGDVEHRRVLSFNASKSNSIYGSSTTVQPESHDWIVCVVAFGTATNVGSVDVANVIRVVDQVQAEVATKLEDSTVHITETWKSDDGTSWYRKYSNGFIEQGGSSVIDENSTKTVNLYTNFTTSNYCVLVTNTSGGGTSDTEGYIFVKTKHTSYVIYSASYLNPNTSSFNWYACGY